jgi:hypothetical protein
MSECRLLINKRVYERLQAMSEEVGRDEVLDEILFVFWGAYPPEWVPYISRDLFAIAGSSLRFVLEELAISTQKESQQAVLDWAEMGDWGALADHVEEGGEIDRQMRAVIAQIMRTKNRRKTRKPQAKRKAEPPRSMKTAEAGLRRAMLVFFLMRAGGAGKSQAVATAAEKFGKDERQIYEDIRAYGESAKYWVSVLVHIQLFTACLALRGRMLGLMTAEQEKNLQEVVAVYLNQEGWLPEFRINLALTPATPTEVK